MFFLISSAFKVVNVGLVEQRVKVLSKQKKGQTKGFPFTYFVELSFFFFQLITSGVISSTYRKTTHCSTDLTFFVFFISVDT